MPERSALLLPVRSAAVLGLLLALLLIPRHGLWVDEAFSLALAGGHSLEHAPADGAGALDWRDAQVRSAGDWAAWSDPALGSFAAIPSAVRRTDTSPPLYYLLLSLWSRICGSGDFALRAFSLLAWAGAWLALSAAFGPAPSLGTAWGLGLLALSPCGLWFASEGRMYALGAAELACFALASARAGERRWQGPWAWAALAAAAAAAWTHYFFLPACLALGLPAWRRAEGGARWRAALAVGGGALSLFPWLLSGAADPERWRLTSGWLKGRPDAVAWLLSPLRLAWQLLSGRAAWSDPDAPLWTPASVLVLVALLLGLRGLRRRQPDGRWLLWAAAGLCTPALFDLWQGTHCSDYPRYAFAALIPLTLLLGEGLAGLAPRARAAALACLGLGWLWGGAQLWSQPSRMNLGLREAAQALPPFLPGDGLVLQSIPSGVIAMSRYLDPAVPVLALNGALTPDPLPALRAFCAGRPRVVLGSFHPAGLPLPADAALASLGRRAGAWSDGHVTWSYFLPPAGAWAFPGEGRKAAYGSRTPRRSISGRRSG
jgi:uncharacterized membrane protein